MLLKSNKLNENQCKLDISFFPYSNAFSCFFRIQVLTVLQKQIHNVSLVTHGRPLLHDRVDGRADCPSVLRERKIHSNEASKEQQEWRQLGIDTHRFAGAANRVHPM